MRNFTYGEQRLRVSIELYKQQKAYEFADLIRLGLCFKIMAALVKLTRKRCIYCFYYFYWGTCTAILGLGVN